MSQSEDLLRQGPPAADSRGVLVSHGELDLARRQRVRRELRALIDGERLLLDIERLCLLLTNGYDVVMDPVTMRVKEMVPMSSSRVTALGKVLDVRLRLLNKVLPDLKAIELSGPDGEPLKTEDGRSERMVLATKLLAVMRDLRDNPDDTTLSEVSRGTLIEGTASHEG